MTLIIFLLILGLIVLVHEFGHFIWAKKSGVYVYEFSIGFGPKLFSFKRKNDPTEYMIKLIPLGGYVLMAGEDGESEDNKKLSKDELLCNKSFFKRLIVLSAGAINNFILGIVLLFIMGLIYGTTIIGTTLDNIPKDGSMYLAGARDGEKIVKVDNKKVKSYDDVQTYLAIVGEGNSAKITLEDKNGNTKTYNVKPKLNKEDNKYYYFTP